MTDDARREYHRPVHRPAATFDRRFGSTDPAEVSRAAHATASALLTRVRDEPEGLRRFAAGHEELLFVEEKAPFVEDQAAKILYHLREGERPRLTGKRDDRGETLLPPDVQLDFATAALAIARRLAALGLEDDALRRG